MSLCGKRNRISVRSTIAAGTIEPKGDTSPGACEDEGGGGKCKGEG
jgi:hypothetical protein